MGLISRVSSRTYRKPNPKTAPRSFSEMPGGSNKYSVQTTNRFAIDAGDSSSSEDEAVSNVDPFQLIKKAETDAVKKTKEQLKAAAKKAKEPAPKKAEVAEEKEEDRPAKRNNRNREPRGNQQQRRGPRKERKPDGEAGGDVAEKKDNNAPLGENNDNRRRRERRPKDRESGNPRTGVRAQEKKGGAGKGNWGKADKNYDADAPAAEEKPTPEESPAEPVEKKEGEEANAEEQENKEPEEQAPPTLTLEEYMASLGSVDAPKNLRKANDGEELKGNTFRSNKIHAEKQPVYTSTGEKHSNKNYIAPENLAFISRGDKGGFFYTDSRDNDRRRGGGIGEGGDRRRGGKGRDNNQNSGPKEFSLKADQDFPSLGGKVAAK